MATEVAKWSSRDEIVLIQIMADHVRKGNRATTTFSLKSWNEIIAEFKEKTGHDWTKEKFKNKFNKLRVSYREFKKLRDQQTGFGWDPITKTVTAPDDVWENYLKSNPGARQFKNKGCPMFDELDLIYGDTTATGAGARASTQPPLDSDDDIVDLGEESRNPLDVGVDDDMNGGNRDVSGKRSRSTTPTSSRRRKRDDESSLDNALLAFRQAEEERADLIRSKNGKAIEDNDDLYSVPKATQILMGIPDLPMLLLVKVWKQIMSDLSFRQSFITFNDERMIELLCTMFGDN